MTRSRPEQLAPDGVRMDAARAGLAEETQIACLAALGGREGDRHVDRERVARDEQRGRRVDAAALQFPLQRDQVTARRPRRVARARSRSP